MIQEQLGRGGAASSPLLGHGNQRKISMTNHDQGFVQPSLSFSPASISASFSPTPLIPSFFPATSSSAAPTAHVKTSGTTATATNYNSTNPETQNLKCPRCDSTNTKFCYYNNYNLTQPRHFCKTCRRYWTKGGALRNVPIGGGCRKNKIAANSSSGSASSNAKHSSSYKVKSCLSITEIAGRHGGFVLGQESELPGFVPSNPSPPIFWPPPRQQGSHILALLRSAQNPNPNSNTNHSPISTANFTLKSDGLVMSSSRSNEVLLGLGYNSQLATNSVAADLSSSLWRNNQQIQPAAVNNQKEDNGFAQNGGGVQYGGFLGQIQRLNSDSSSKGSGRFGDHHPVGFSNSSTVSSSSASSCPSSLSIISKAATASMTNPMNYGGDFGFLVSPLSWSDFPRPSGSAYP